MQASEAWRRGHRIEKSLVSMCLTLQEVVDTVALSLLALRLDSSHPPGHQATEHLSQATEVHLNLHAPALKHQGCPTPSPADLATAPLNRPQLRSQSSPSTGLSRSKATGSGGCPPPLSDPAHTHGPRSQDLTIDGERQIATISLIHSSSIYTALLIC